VTRHRKFALMLLPFPILLFGLSFTGLYASDYAFYGGLALLVALKIAMIVSRHLDDSHEA